MTINHPHFKALIAGAVWGLFTASFMLISAYTNPVFFKAMDGFVMAIGIIFAVWPLLLLSPYVGGLIVTCFPALNSPYSATLEASIMVVSNILGWAFTFWIITLMTSFLSCLRLRILSYFINQLGDNK